MHLLWWLSSSGRRWRNWKNLQVGHGQLEEIPGIRNITSSIEGGAPEVEIVIDRYRAGLMNVDVNTLINRVSEKLQGSDAGQMTLKGDLTDITVKLNDITLQELEMLSVEVNNTEILLREVADIELGSSPREILHNNQNRIVEISADLDTDLPLDRVATAIDQKLGGVEFPPKYSYQITGEEAMRKESMGSLGFALLLSLILVYMVMAAQFESLIHPFTILLPIPLAVVGAVAVFYLQGKALNIMALIGIILLVGIAVNDSIILVDAINQFRKGGDEAEGSHYFGRTAADQAHCDDHPDHHSGALPAYTGIWRKCIPALTHGLGSDRRIDYLDHADTGGDPLHLYGIRNSLGLKRGKRGGR